MLRCCPQDLRTAPGNTGNVEENKSLYWNPAIYKVLNQASNQKTYELVPVWFASAYYIWRTGQAVSNYLSQKTDNFMTICQLVVIKRSSK